MMKILLVFSFLVSQLAFSQNLSNERIRKIGGRKKSIYLDKGIFHSGNRSPNSTLKAIRHNYSKKNGYERVVFDFTTNHPPKVYGYMSNKEKKIYMDLFKTKVGPKIGSFGNSKFVKDLEFFQFSEESLAVEMIFKNQVSIDIFYLENPGRLIIDIKK